MLCRVCDRCNKPFPEYPIDETPHDANAIIFVRKNALGLYNNPETVELCPECLKKLDKWLKG